MHEMSIARGIIDIVTEEMTRHGVEKTKAVNIAVGKFTAVAPDQLAFCFSMAVAGTSLEGARLNIREVPFGYECQSCGAEFTFESIVTACPECGATNPRLTAGRELTIESIEV